MTDEEISRLTIGDLERIAERFGKAVADIRAAQALLGAPAHMRAAEVGRSLPVPMVIADEQAPHADEDPTAAHRRRQFQPVEQDQPRALAYQPDARAKLTAAERAERERMMRQRMASAPVDPNLPDDIAAMERGE